MHVDLPFIALVKRELLASLRRPRSFACLMLFVGCFAGLAILMWPSSGKISVMRAYSEELFAAISVFMMGGALFFVPGLAAGAITNERDNDTFDLLYMSLITPAGIVAAKLLNTIGFYVLLLAASGPVFALVFFTVGLDWVQFTQVTAVIMLTALTCSMIGIWCSTFFMRSFVAQVLSYLAVMGFMIGTWPVAILGLALRWLPFFDTIGIVVCPGRSLVAVMNQEMTIVRFVLVVIFHGCIIAFLFVRSLRLIASRPQRIKVSAWKPIDDPLLLELRMRTWPYYLIDPLRRKRLMQDGRNPMLIKELRWGVMNRGTSLIRSAYAAFLLFFISGTVMVYYESDREALVAWLAMQTGVVLLIAPTLLATSITKEREFGNSDMLGMTLLSARDVVLGKLWSGLVSIGPVVIAALAACLPFFFLKSSNYRNWNLWPVVFMGYVTLLVCTFLSLAIGLFASQIARRSSTGLLLSFLFNLLVFVGFVGMLTGVTEFFDMDGVSHKAVAFASPLVAFIIDEGVQHGSSLSIYWLSNVLLYAFLGVAVVWLTVRRFEQYFRRET
ncbi:ABC transporter permease subunit [Candidatus Hydrogenedentota bacterium]